MGWGAMRRPGMPTSRRLSIFVCYRRDDTVDAAGRLYDALVARFGRESVFLDIDSIDPGVNFGEVVAQGSVPATCCWRSSAGSAHAGGAGTHGPHQRSSAASSSPETPNVTEKRSALLNGKRNVTAACNWGSVRPVDPAQASTAERACVAAVNSIEAT
jgi:hypothetical protein